jgi:hypothetical protein
VTGEQSAAVFYKGASPQTTFKRKMNLKFLAKNSIFDKKLQINGKKYFD